MPDKLLLRVPLFVCLLGLVAGNCVTAFVKTGMIAGRWIILVSLIAGVIFSVLYTAHILFCRLHQRLRDLLAVILIHGCVMAVVIQTYRWLGNYPAIWGNLSAGIAWNALLLAVSALAILFRASVMALIAVNCLPEEWSDTLVVSRKQAVIPKTEQRIPRWYISLFFWLSPLAWWTLLLLAASYNILQLSMAVAASLFAIFTFLQLRLMLSGSVYFNIAREWWQNSKPVDRQFTREARWYLAGSGLPAAGILSFYAFCFAAARIQHNALGAVLAAQVAEHNAQLRKLQPPSLPDEQNALNFYSQAHSVVPYNTDYALFTYRWNHPDALKLIQKASQCLEYVHAGAALERCQFVPDYGADTASLEKTHLLNLNYMGHMLMLEARYAAADGDWEKVLRNSRSSFMLAAHLYQQPFLLTHRLATYLEDRTLMALLPALIRSEFPPPPDSVFERAQKMIRDFESRNPNALSRVLQTERLWTLRQFDQKYSSENDSWPGAIDVVSMAGGQPFQCWESRVVLMQYHTWLQSTNYDKDQAATYFKSPYSLPRTRIGIHQVNMTDCREVFADLDRTCAYKRADAALAAARFKLRRRRWPMDLAECVPDYLPALPGDPFKPGEFLRFASDPPRIHGSGFDSGYPSPQSDTLFDELCGPVTNGDMLLFIGPRNTNALSNEELDEKSKINIFDELEFMESKDEDTRQMAMRNLGKLAPANCPTLISKCLRWLESEEVEDKIWAAYVLGRVGESAHSALEKLEREFTENSDPDVRHFSRDAVRKIRGNASEIAQTGSAPK